MPDDPAPDMFVYGTLRFAPIVSALLGRTPSMTPATVEGWRAAALSGRVYPGLVSAPNGRCRGMRLAGLHRSDRALFDLFEGDAYEPRTLGLTDGRSAVAYVWRDRADVTAEDWDPEQFATRHLGAYVERCRAWRSGSPGEPPP